MCGRPWPCSSRTSLRDQPARERQLARGHRAAGSIGTRALASPLPSGVHLHVISPSGRPGDLERVPSGLITSSSRARPRGADEERRRTAAVGIVERARSGVAAHERTSTSRRLLLTSHLRRPRTNPTARARSDCSPGAMPIARSAFASVRARAGRGGRRRRTNCSLPAADSTRTPTSALPSGSRTIPSTIPPVARVRAAPRRDPSCGMRCCAFEGFAAEARAPIGVVL